MTVVEYVAKSTELSKYSNSIANDKKNMTIKNKYPMPRIDGLFDQLFEASTFQKLIYDLAIINYEYWKRMYQILLFALVMDTFSL